MIKLFLEPSHIPCNLWCWASDPWIIMFAKTNLNQRFDRISHVCWRRWVLCSILPASYSFFIWLTITNKRITDLHLEVHDVQTCLCQKGLLHIWTLTIRHLCIIYSPKFIYLSKVSFWLLHIYSELEKPSRSVLGDILVAIQIDLLEASFFQLSLSPTVVINCVTLSGPSGLNDGGDQEEDASHEGGEGQPDGPLWQLWAGQLGLFFNFVEFSIQHKVYVIDMYLAKKTWSVVLQLHKVRERRS